MKKITKAVEKYLIDNIEKPEKDLSDETGLTVGQVKEFIKSHNEKSLDKLIEKSEKDSEKRKKKKLLKFGISEDGNSVVMTPGQSALDDDASKFLQNDDFMKRYGKNIHVIKRKNEQ